jgi:hypothetical protein
MNALRGSATLAVVSFGLMMACRDDCCTPPPPSPSGVTINGVVRDPVGEPITDAVVLVPGKGSDTTAADGRFSIPDVMPPYDIEVFVRSQNTLEVYKGLTRSDPIIDWWTGDAGPRQTATITGTVPPSSLVSSVFFVGGPSVVGLGNANRTTGQYSITVSWNGSTTLHSGVLYLLRWQPQSLGDPGVVPVSYDGYASKPLTISAGGTFSGNDFATSEVADPPEQSIAGSVSVPAGSPPLGYTLNSRALDLEFVGAHFRWVQVNNPANIPFGIVPATFTYTVPAIAGVVFSVYADAYERGEGWTHFFKRDIAANSTNAVVPLETPPYLLSPADSASAIDATTPFRWTQGGGTGVNILSVIPDDPANPRFYVLTTATDATLPNLVETGVPWPAGAGYHWFVEKDFPLASIDEAASDWFWDVDSGDYGWTGSERYSFTTKAAAGAAARAPVVGPTAPLGESIIRRGLILRPGALVSGQVP